MNLYSDGYEVVLADSKADLRAWLEANYGGPLDLPMLGEEVDTYKALDLDSDLELYVQDPPGSDIPCHVEHVSEHDVVPDYWPDGFDYCVTALAKDWADVLSEVYKRANYGAAGCWRIAEAPSYLDAPDLYDALDKDETPPMCCTTMFLEVSKS